MVLTISIIGPGNVEYYYEKLEKIPKDKVVEHIREISKVLAKTNTHIEFLANKGVAFDIGILYKEFKGKKILSANPLSDKVVGIGHILPFIEHRYNDKRMIDELIDAGDWPKTNQIKGLFGDAILYLGKTLGTDLELNNAAYMYKWHHKNKKYPLNLIHKQIKAGKKFPLTIIVYSPFLKSGKLEYETEQYLKKEGIRLIYAKSPRGLKTIIEKLK
jgi:hypothetical protein